MNNLDELIKAGRCCVDRSCGDCERLNNALGSETDCRRELIAQAADAIEALQAENISLRAERDQARLDCAIAERNHMNTLERFLEAQERITELTAERDALLKAVEKPSVMERGD